MEYKLTYANRIGAVGSNCGCNRRRRQSQQRKALSGWLFEVEQYRSISLSHWMIKERTDVGKDMHAQ